MPGVSTARLRAPNGHTIPVPARRVTVGESPGCDIPIAHGLGMAAVHFRLQPWEQGHFIEDAGPGVQINGSTMTWAPLKHGDRITAGAITLIYENTAEPLPAFPAGEPGAPPPLPVQHVPVEPVPPEPPAAAPPPEGEKPPAWLPQEALLPPAPPPRWTGAATAPARRSRGLRWLLALLLPALAGAAFFFLRR